MQNTPTHIVVTAFIEGQSGPTFRLLLPTAMLVVMEGESGKAMVSDCMSLALADPGISYMQHVLESFDELQLELTGRIAHEKEQPVFTVDDLS